jgi:DNA modification methylase
MCCYPDGVCNINAYIVKSDARHIPLADGAVDCCVTSPPYWGLRDYGTARWDGGVAGCDHVNGRPGSANADGGATLSSHKNRDGAGAFSGDCGKCGARRIDAQLGLERTPEEYVASMVQVFRGVRRVLKPQGTLWLNLGDSYAANRGHQVPDTKWVDVGNSRGMKAADSGLKPKDLVGIPWRVAFALQADGWWLRSDIIWAKPNPMPESVTDRPTRSHEYIFLLAKSARYWYDAEAVAEPCNWNGSSGTKNYRAWADGGRIDAGMNSGGAREERNSRSVWTIATQPYSGAHFATFPEELARRCIRAGCPVGGKVLDPFAGSGTVGKVAIEEGRDAVLCDINYQPLAKERIREVQRPLLNI